MHFVTKRRAALVATLFVALGITACGKKDAEPADTATVTVPPVSSPLRVTDIQLGNGVGSDKRIVEPTSTFGTRDTIYVSVTTDGAASDARLTATWMYGDQGVSEADEMLTSSGGVNVSEFHISKETPWPTGSYRVDVKLDGQTVGTREFRIQ
ncbi:MAG: hypothetical protein NUW01_02190 [Gemmatimonadaceae bacterium]|nr:hypothetical protein [Gemmatimonadaceae bacterium]